MKTVIKHIVVLGMFFGLIFLLSCEKEETLDCDDVQIELDKGTPILTILESCSVGRLFGKHYQGGLIFYVNSFNGTGLIAAKEDLPRQQWITNLNYSTTYIYDSLLFEGDSNTIELVNYFGEGTYAAKVCHDLELDGYSDWYLPSKYEMESMGQNLNAYGYSQFDSWFYWTSTEYIMPNSTTTWYACSFSFNYNTHGRAQKSFDGNIRPVRSF